MQDFDKNVRTLLILDDKMTSVGPGIEDLFTKGSHHKNLTVMYLTQNLFFSAKQRTISLNSHYIILFKNVRDTGQITTLARQISTGKQSYQHFMIAYLDATSVPYGVLLVDLRPETPDKLRLRTGILPHVPTYVYTNR